MQKALLLPAVLLAASARAEVRLPAVLGDHAVLQCGRPAPVWGAAAPGEKVVVRFAGQEKAAVADAAGRWRVDLDPMPASAEPRELSANGATAKGLLVGEVWICSGQSNMEMSLLKTDGGAEEAARANHPQLRLFNVPKRPAAEPQADCEGRWEPCAPAAAGAFSAGAYHFGLDLQRELKVPVGLIQSSWSGTPAEAWMSREGLKPVQAFAMRRGPNFGLPAQGARRGRADPEALQTPSATGVSPLASHALFDGMVAPLAPCGVRGVAWYHGGANSSGPAARNYQKLLPALIADWRARWAQADLPFLIVQLANIGAPAEDPNTFAGRTVVRDAQLKTLSVPNTGLVVAIDCGGDGEKHPKDKTEISRRLALLALAKAYGRPVEASGPIYDGMTVEGPKVRVRFRSLGGGLVSTDGKPLARFALAGADQRFAWADAAIEGDTVVVSSAQVPQPVAVRYAFSENPAGCNLGNKAGLPASPFRSDDW